MEAAKYPRLVFEFPFNERAAFEAEARGYKSHVSVEFEDGKRCPVLFYDPVRLQQDLEVEAAEGKPYISDPGMIVIPTVTLPHMEFAVQRLFLEGYFDAFVRIPPTSTS